MRILNGIFLILFLAAVVVFCIQNPETVVVKFFSWSMRVPMPLLALVVYLLGMLTGWSVISLLRRSFKAATHKPQ